MIPVVLIAGLCLPGLLQEVAAQVEHKHNFKAKDVISVVADPPVDLEHRRAEFAVRNQAKAIQKLADELFGMIRQDWSPEGEALRATYQRAVHAYGAGRYEEALEAYKRFFIQRVMDSGDKGKDPATRRFIEFYSEADGLMKGEARVAAFTKDFPDHLLRGHNPVDDMLNYYRQGQHDDYHVMVDLKIGEPGEVNWTYVLKDLYGPTWHMPRDERFLSFAYKYDDFFVSLLAKYVETGDSAYLLRWAGYVDDFHLNFIPDLQRAPWADRFNWTQVGGPALDTLVFAMRAHPEAVDLLPAPTLARMVLHNWRTHIPLMIQLSRTGVGNRRLNMYGRHMNRAFFAFPELAERDYLLRQRRRTLEDHTRIAIHPDGTDVEYALPYFHLYYQIPQQEVSELRNLPEASWMTDQWIREIRRTQSLVGSVILRSLDPLSHQPGHRHALRNIMDTTPHIRSLAGRMEELNLTAPEHSKIMEWQKGQRPQDVPLRSFAFPYGGFYYIWSDWSDQPQFMHLNSPREGSRNRWRFMNNIWLTAYDQLMLFFGAEDYMLEVDGVGGMASGRTAEPPSLAPQPNRNASTEFFNFMEATLVDDSRSHFNLETGVEVPVGPVTHQRQVLFARDAEIWIVTDRVAGERKHDYRFLWPFRGDFPFDKGALDFRGRAREVPENSYLDGYRPETDFEFDTTRNVIRTTNPHIPNLSIYHSSDRELSLPDGEFVQHNWRFANALGTGPRIHDAQRAVMASLLYPRKDAEDELLEYIDASSDGGAGFDARTLAGHRVRYRAAGVAPSVLKIGQVEVLGEALLWTERPDDGVLRGVALGAETFSVDGETQSLPGPDFTFEWREGQAVAFEPILYPMEMVCIEPKADRFIDALTVSLSHPEPGVSIRYTLDGSLPTTDSPLYTGSFEIRENAWVTAVAVRPGVDRILETTDSISHSLPHWAIYEKEAPREPAQAARPSNAQSGVMAVYRDSEQPMSMLNLMALPVAREGAVPGLFDLSLRADANPVHNYGFVYTGYLDIPRDGVYTFHAPTELVNGIDLPWYDLRVFLNGEEWYPAARRQNFGAWSVPLKAGSHAIDVRWVDQRPPMGIRADNKANLEEADRYWYEPAPALELSGPDMERQEIPQTWLHH